MPKPSRRAGFEEAPQAAFDSDMTVDADPALLKALGRGKDAAEAARKSAAKSRAKTGKRKQIADHVPAPDPQKAPRGFGAVPETDIAALPADFDPSAGVSATVSAMTLAMV